MLLKYSESKESFDEKMSNAVKFDYKVIDSFENSGNKISAVLENSAIFIDCRYVQNDFK